ncbi:MAG: DUF1579 family protein, partial [Planctomycetaceae bacterium]|nr:DUF1579 family protein [Planctomycetaceae bacterium]
MKKVVGCTLVAAIVAGSFALGTFVTAEDKKAGTEEGGSCGMTPEQMEQCKAYATPGKEHKGLEWFVGTWEGECKDCMNPDSKEAKTTTAKIEAKSILGGRYIEEVFTGTCPCSGESFEGHSITGYDNKLKTYNNYWFCTMGTGAAVSTGEYKEADKTYRYSGTMTCPLEGKIPSRNEVKIIDDNTYE